MGKRVEPVVDFGERRATRGVAGFGAIVRSGGSRPSACRPVVAGGLDHEPLARGLDPRGADRRGVLRGPGQRAALAVDFWPQGGRGAARPQGAGSHGGQSAGGLVGHRRGLGARSRGSAELDLATSARRDRAAHRRALLEIAAQRGPEKRGFAWRRPRHTLKGRQDADAVDRSGLRLCLFKQQAEAGDITLLFSDESEALTHPYLAHAWAKRGADLRVEAPGQSHKRAMLGVLDVATRRLIVNTSATKRSGDFIALLGRLDAVYGPCPAHGSTTGSSPVAKGPPWAEGPRPQKPVILVLDNGPIHTSKASRAALAERAWLTVEWLPKYAPELNDIERSWRDLKCHFLAHQTFSDPDHLDRAIHKAIAAMNQERHTRVCTNLRNAA